MPILGLNWLICGLQSGSWDFYSFLVAYIKSPEAVFISSRLALAICSTLTVFFTYLVGRRLFGRWAGLTAALFLGFSFLAVSESHYIKGDALATMFTILAFYFILGMWKEGRRRDYILASIFIGLALVSKHYTFPILVPFVGAHILRPENLARLRNRQFWAMVSERNLLLSGLVLVMTILVFMPMLWLHPRSWASLTLSAWRMLSASSPGPKVWLDTFTDHLAGGLGLPLELLCLLGLVWLLLRRDSITFLFLSFPALFFLFLARGLGWARYDLPLLPFLVIAGAFVIQRLVDRLPAHRQGWIMAVVGILIAAPSLLTCLQFDYLITRPDTRFLARQWLETKAVGKTMVIEGGLTYDQSTSFLGPQVKGRPDIVRSNFEKFYRDLPFPFYLDALLDNLKGRPPFRPILWSELTSSGKAADFPI